MIKDIQGQESRPDWTRLALLAALVCLFLGFRAWKFITTENIVLWWDSAAYALVSFWPVGAEQFWFGRQPPLYPMFFKFFAYPADSQTMMFGPLADRFSFAPGVIYGLDEAASFHLVKDGYDVVSMSILQFGIAAASWSIFAIAAGQAFKSARIQILVTTTLLVVGCESSITLWDRHIMTEAVSISLFVLILSFLLHFRKTVKSPATVLLFLLIVSLFSLIRMTNNYFLVFICLFVAYHGWSLGPRFRFASGIIICALAGLIAFNQYTLFKGERAKFPMQSLVSSRISSPGFEDIYAHFRENGMPEIPESFHGTLWRAPYEDYPELDDWMKTSAPSVYQRYLLSHPGYFLGQPFVRANDLNKPLQDILTPDLKFYEISEGRTFNMVFTDIFLLLSLLAAAAIAVHRRDQWSTRRPDLLLPPLVVAASFATLFVVWHGDLVDIDRHAVQLALGLRLGLILMIAALIDSEPADSESIR